MSSNHKIKTGILSFGMSGKLFHAPFIEENDGFDFWGVVERSKKIAREFYPNIKSYDSVDDLISDEDLELVIINTPNSTHYEFALKAIQAKKHVLVEKPFTITSDEARKLFHEAKKRNIKIFAYQNRRFDSDFLSVKQTINSGKLGNIIEAHIRYDRYRYALGTSIFKEGNVPGSGVSYNLGPHIIDQALALFGIPKNWTKVVAGFRPNTIVDDYSHVHFEYENGLQVFITASLLVAEPQPSYVINGTLGTYTKHRVDIQEEQLQQGLKPNNSSYGIEKPGFEGILTIVSPEGSVEKEFVPAVKTTYNQLFDDVYDCIIKGIPYPISEEQIIKQLEILEKK